MAAERVDLNAVMADLRTETTKAMSAEQMSALQLRFDLVAELRAAREVVEACQGLGAIMAGADSAEWVEIMRALAAYDETLGRRVTIPEGR